MQVYTTPGAGQLLVNPGGGGGTGLLLHAVPVRKPHQLAVRQVLQCQVVDGEGGVGRGGGLQTRAGQLRNTRPGEEHRAIARPRPRPGLRAARQVIRRDEAHAQLAQPLPSCGFTEQLGRDGLGSQRWLKVVEGWMAATMKGREGLTGERAKCLAGRGGTGSGGGPGLARSNTRVGGVRCWLGQ